MAKILIRIVSFVGCLTAVVSAWHTNNTTWYFTGLALFLTFLGTFAGKKEQPSGHKVSQTGGAFSNNNQTVSFGVSEQKEKEKDSTK